ncbi:hypothetical protein [Salidesulfovibrio brasiliensis]|uniref:hypothetical protein n=1 Tax=Salidesulfovibrio brasiliensis TaxID=221711 RepID=UPI0006D1C22E|nr:hypothetical protein [Salidesulfovibrio brasiliensis]
MSNLKDYADGLQQDVVSEMAEHYFGARKNLESMIEVLQEWAEELRFKEGRVLAAAGNLHALLIDEKTVRDFYMSLDIVPACVPPFEESLKATNMDRVPFALTRKGRWTKCVKEAYHGLSKATDTYLNGTYYTDEEGRKRLTVHYIRLKAMVQYVNEEVIRVNEDMSPSEPFGTSRTWTRSMWPRKSLSILACQVKGVRLTAICASAVSTWTRSD